VPSSATASVCSLPLAGTSPSTRSMSPPMATTGSPKVRPPSFDTATIGVSGTFGRARYRLDDQVTYTMSLVPWLMSTATDETGMLTSVSAPCLPRALRTIEVSHVLPRSWERPRRTLMLPHVPGKVPGTPMSWVSQPVRAR
jgi:hypothetical protein